jgi:hypothetical protein
MNGKIHIFSNITYLFTTIYLQQTARIVSKRHYGIVMLLAASKRKKAICTFVSIHSNGHQSIQMQVCVAIANTE